VRRIPPPPPRSPQCVHVDPATTTTSYQEVISLYLGSVFCLQPMGDNPVRRGVFDSWLSGCIPIVFAAATADFPWWVPPEVRNL
jgi:hypothetical protein